MRLNFLFFFSPLEQFEISSYNTFLNYNTTFPLELFENNYILNYFPITFYSLIDLLFILLIIKSFQLLIKSNGFIFLYIFILVLLTCINLFSFTDFLIYEGSFKFNSTPEYDLLKNQIESYFNREGTVTAHYYWNFLDLLQTFPAIFQENNAYLQYAINENEAISTKANSFFLANFIPNLIFNAELFIGYSWFLGVLFYKQSLNSENISLNIGNEAANKIQVFSSKWINNENLNWFCLLEDENFIYLRDSFLPKFILPIDSVKTIFLENDSLFGFRSIACNLNNSNFEFPLENTFYGWAVFLLVIVGLIISSSPEKFGLNICDKNIFENVLVKKTIEFKTLADKHCESKTCIPFKTDNDFVIDFIRNNLSQIKYNNIYNEIINISINIYPEIFTLDSLAVYFELNREFPMLLKHFLNKNESLNLNIPVYFNFKLNTDLFIKNIYENFNYITINSSFINIYNVFFCFIFILLTVYLIFNKSLSNNTNALIPNIYQMFGENIFKISLNLFYSVLGKHISHPEFFIKINTIFLFLIIGNIQGMIPYLSTLTSALTNTFFIALGLFISIIMTLLDKKGVNYFLNLFMPSGCPIFLVLLLIPIEIISYSFRVVSLSVRLFANMMAGHTLLKVIVGFSWVIVFLGNTFIINLFPIIILFILILLEFGVALIQSYIFTILSCIYLRDIFNAGH